MDVMNCRTCGRMFNRLGNESVCPSCARELEDKFQQVKEYLRENPKSPLEVVSKENDVSVKQIKRWVREERLVFSDDSPVGIECEMCGKMIHSGRFCAACKGSLANTFSDALDKPKAPEPTKKRKSDGNKMRFLQQA